MVLNQSSPEKTSPEISGSNVHSITLSGFRHKPGLVEGMSSLLSVLLGRRSRLAIWTLLCDVQWQKCVGFECV